MQQSDLNSLIDMEKDIINHSEEDLSYLDSIFKSDLFSKSEIESINQALKMIINDDRLTEENKGNILQNSWKINHKFKPPTAEEFLSEKWIGPQALDLYNHVKKRFVEYFDPLTNKNKLIMYCCT